LTIDLDGEGTTAIKKNSQLVNQADVSYDTVKETMEIKGTNNTLQG